MVYKFSLVCKWCVVIKEDKDNSFQFAKNFQLQILKVTVFPLYLHYVYGKLDEQVVALAFLYIAFAIRCYDANKA